MNGPTFFHKSVLMSETITCLLWKRGGIYVDATFGSGGHTRAILTADPTCTVIGIDWDKKSLDTYAPLIQNEFGDRFIPQYGNFTHIARLLEKLEIKEVDGILADFGTSQMQIIERPGFSFMHDTPLDMRMSPGHQKIWAADIVNQASEKELAHIFYEYGGERYSRKIAQALVDERAKQPFRTTKQLADFIKRVVPSRGHMKIHPATKVFQALRIQVNNELENIEVFLKNSTPFLSSKGRIVCITFHSLEDRIVKQFFREQEQAGMLTIVTKKPLVPSSFEISTNPSSRSAKIRAAARMDRDK